MVQLIYFLEYLINIFFKNKILFIFGLSSNSKFPRCKIAEMIENTVSMISFSSSSKKDLTNSLYNAISSIVGTLEIADWAKYLKSLVFLDRIPYFLRLVSSYPDKKW